MCASPREPQPDDPIEIGRVGKPHGVRGGFVLLGAIDAAALVPGLRLTIAGGEYELASRGGTEERPILRLAGLDDRDAAAALRGEAVTAPRERLSPLAEGEWYARDLIGLRVQSRDGEELGAVDRLANTPSVDVLEVTRADGARLLVPMVRDAIVEIAPARGVIVVDAGFLAIE